jgi:hypothetical protein
MKSGGKPDASRGTPSLITCRDWPESGYKGGWEDKLNTEPKVDSGQELDVPEGIVYILVVLG